MQEQIQSIEVTEGLSQTEQYLTFQMIDKSYGLEILNIK